MVCIGFGCPGGIYYNVDGDFKNLFNSEWMKDDFNWEIITQIDHCEWDKEIGCFRDIEDGYTFGMYEISTGSKALMLCHNLENVRIWGSIFGDNCWKLLWEIAERKDIKIYLEHLPVFDRENFSAFSLTKDRMYDSYMEFLKEWLDYLASEESE